MNRILQNVLVVFFAVNGIFWGLMPHSMHCDLISQLLPECPSHNIHIAMGFITFLIAIVLAQLDHFKRMFN